MFRFQADKMNSSIELGTGAFGTVYPYQKSSGDNRWVVKFINCSNFEKLSVVLQEIVLGFSCDHPCILPIRGYYIIPSQPAGWQVYIKMPRMVGDLRRVLKTHLQRNSPIAETDVIKYFYSLASAIDYLHGKRITHRDIKPENVLIDSKGNIKLSDVGGAKFVGDEESLQIVSDVAGTSAYLAPELADKQMLKKKSLNKTDLWSLGIVAAELCLLQRIPGTMREADIKRKLNGLKGKYNQVILDLIMGLLKYKPETRKTAAEVKKTLEAHFGEILKTENTEEIKFENPSPPAKSSKNEDEGFFKSFTSLWGKDKKKEMEESKITDMNSSFKSLNTKKKISKLDEYFSITPTGFDIKVLNPNGVKDGSIKDMLIDLEKRLEENKLSNLENLSINLENCEKLKDQAVESLGGLVAKNLKELKKLHFNLTNCKLVSDVGANNLAHQIGTLKNLNDLDLSFKGCASITNQGAKGISNQIAPHLKKLEKLGLHFYGCFQVMDQGVTDVVTSVGTNLTKLNQLKLTFSHCEKITDQSISALATQVGSNLKALQHLELNFVSCKQISDVGYKDLATHLMTNLTNLHFLDFNFGVWDKYTDQAIKDGAAHVEANLKNLPHIGLNVRDCKKVTDEGLIELMTQLGKNLKNLEYLGLNFSYCSKITDRGISSIGEHIGANLKKLEKLDLNLSYCKHISNEGVQALFGHIGENLTLLSQFKINLWNCKQVNDDGLRALATLVVAKLPNIVDLDVDFDCCHDVTDKGVQDLITNIKTSLKNLKHLSLNFWNCTKLTEQMKMSLKILFKTVPKLNIRF